jgi:hypothetical protein
MNIKRKIINENFSPFIRRRLSSIDFDREILNVIEYEIGSPCDLASSASEFAMEVSDMLCNNIYENFEYEYEYTFTPKEKDSMFHFVFDNYGEYAYNYYKNHCMRGLRESKRQFIISESRINDVIYDYINSYYETEELTIESPPEEPGLTTFIDSYDENFVFLYFTETFFEFMERYDWHRGRGKTPLLEMKSSDYDRFETMFNDLWKDPMKKWFEDKFGLSVNYITRI